MFDWFLIYYCKKIRKFIAFNKYLRISKMETNLVCLWTDI
jgi:hypothetical protein